MEIYCVGMEFFLLVMESFLLVWNFFFFFFCVRHVLESLLNELMEMKNLGLMGILVGWH